MNHVRQQPGVAMMLTLQSAMRHPPVKLEPQQAPEQFVLIEGPVDEEVLLEVVHHDYKAGNFKSALSHCLTVYHTSPKWTDEKGGMDLAIQYYSMAIKLKPNFCDAWSNLASAYMRKGMLQEAAECCRHALSLNPRLVDAHSNLGNLLKAQGLTHHAYLCYMEALQIHPNFAIAWSNLAGLLMEAGELQRALNYYLIDLMMTHEPRDQFKLNDAIGGNVIWNSPCMRLKTD